ncbi:MAG: peptidoglycan DD-metalloendopeptidase family protein [Lachnospiraceae bacterium]
MDNSFDMYNKKLKKEKKDDDNKSTLSKFLFTILIKSLIVVLLFLSSMIFIRQNDKNKKIFKEKVYNNSLSFAKIYNLYSKYLGDALPFKDTIKDDTKKVSNEKITYSSIKKEGDDYLLEIPSNYTLQSIKSGIVIEVKKNDKYKNIVKIQDKSGVNITYKNLNEVEVKLYDYVEKGEILGSTSDKLYINFEKDGKYLSYEKYL